MNHRINNQAGSDPHPAARHPRVSPTVRRRVNWVLTGIWLVGLVVLLEILHTGWWAPIALLAVVLMVELVFVRWNEGRWPVGKRAATVTSRTPDRAEPRAERKVRPSARRAGSRALEAARPVHGRDSCLGVDSVNG